VKILDDTLRGFPAIEYGLIRDRSAPAGAGNEETWPLLPDGRTVRRTRGPELTNNEISSRRFNDEKASDAG